MCYNTTHLEMLFIVILNQQIHFHTPLMTNNKSNNTDGPDCQIFLNADTQIIKYYISVISFLGFFKGTLVSDEHRWESRRVLFDRSWWRHCDVTFASHQLMHSHFYLDWWQNELSWGLPFLRIQTGSGSAAPAPLFQQTSCVHIPVQGVHFASLTQEILGLSATYVTWI